MDGILPRTISSNFTILHAESRMRRGLTPVGLFGEAERRRHLSYLADWNKSARRRDLVDQPGSRSIASGVPGKASGLDKIESPLILNVPVPDQLRPIRVELHGRTELVLARIPASITPVVRDTVAVKDFLAGFLDAIVLSLLPGGNVGDGYHAHVIPGGDSTDFSSSHREFHGIDPVRAREFLIALLSDLLGSSHAYLLPCEAVFDFLSRNRSIQSSVEEMKESEGKACSSRYGPVPNFEEYEPPDDDEVHRIVQRRFGLFWESGGMGT